MFLFIVRIFLVLIYVFLVFLLGCVRGLGVFRSISCFWSSCIMVEMELGGEFVGRDGEREGGLG